MNVVMEAYSDACLNVNKLDLVGSVVHACFAKLQEQNQQEVVREWTVLAGSKYVTPIKL